MTQDKRSYREYKRAVKRAGNKKRRGKLKRQLQEAPEEAHMADLGFGRFQSAKLNARDLEPLPLGNDAGDDMGMGSS